MKFLIEKWFSKQTEAEAPVTLEQATALLLFEAATADYELDEKESNLLLASLESGLNISAATASELLQWAKDHSHISTSLQPFTQVVNNSLSPEEKTTLMTTLWKIAYADGRLDKYEEHYLRHIADLIYLPHSFFIKAKIAAQPS